MIQNIIVLIIVFATTSYIIYSIYKSLTRKKSSNPCDGCSGCEFKNMNIDEKFRERNDEVKR